MNLKISKWKNATQAPVVFVIDDLANIYIKKTTSTALQIGEDWGHSAHDKNSMWNFLNINLLEKFPHIKSTFLLVTGQRTAMTKDAAYTYNQAMDGDEKFVTFLKYLQEHPNVELAYHGTTHGKAGETVQDFLQEWETFNTLEEAVNTTKQGKKLFKSVLGKEPQGGKYCGYKEGKYGKNSIEKSGFKWWSYHEDNHIWDKNSTDPRYKYDLEFIQGVVNIPTTVDASNLSLKVINKLFTRKYLKSIYLYIKERKTVERHIDSLYHNSEVISIYEHTSPYMTTEQIQYPNIITDIENLNIIFSLLAKKDIWYATCDELADYFIDREKTALIMTGENQFKLTANENLNSELTLTFHNHNNTYALHDSDDNFLAEFKSKKEVCYVTYPFKIDYNYKIIEVKTRS